MKYCDCSLSDFVFRVVDKDDNPLKFKLLDNYSDTLDGKRVLNLVVKGYEEPTFTDDEIYLIMGLLHKALDYGGTYKKMSELVALMDKLNERNYSK